MMRYWLLKSEPSTFSWTDLLRLGQDMWDGVRNYQARNYLRSMRVGDRALFYHSGKEKAIQGVVEILTAHYPDPTAEGSHSWLVVDVVPIETLPRPLSLRELRQEAQLAEMVLLNNSRLSVQPVLADEFAYILALSKGSLCFL